MKLNFPTGNKPAEQPAETPAAKPKGLQIGTPKVAEPAMSLQERLAQPKAATEQPKSGLNALLANKPADKPVAAKPKDAPKVILASESEKYVLNAEATEQLPQTVLDDYAAKMQHMIYAMDTQELGTALHSVLNFAQENPHLRSILRADDIRLVVHAARQSYALTVVAKTKNKGRTTKTTQLAKDIMDDLAGVSFTI